MPFRNSIKYHVLSIKQFIHNTEYKIHNTKQSKSAGFSLIEILLGLIILTLIVIALYSIYLYVFKLFIGQNVSVNVSTQNKLALEDIASTVKQAAAVEESCYTLNCKKSKIPPWLGPGSAASYNMSGPTNLVLRFAPLDSAGNPLANYDVNCTPSPPACSPYPDYINYYIDPGTTNLIKETSTNYTDGARKSGKKILATNVSSINFAYTSALPVLPAPPTNQGLFTPAPKTTQVAVTITTTGKIVPRDYTLTRTATARIRNKALVKPTLPDTDRTTCNNGTAPPCTGSGQDADYTSANSATCDPNFTANGDGTVTDNCTNLTWQKCTRGQDPITCSGTVSTTGWTSALSYCQGLSLAGSGWRMPNFKELQSIVNYQSGLAGIDPTIFPNTDPDRYWSSTAGSTAWVVNFPEEPGAVDMLQVSTSFSERIRCVRDAG